MWVRHARTQTTATAARLASVGDAVTSRRASTSTDDTWKLIDRCASCADTSGERPGSVMHARRGLYVGYLCKHPGGWDFDRRPHYIGIEVQCYEPCGADEYIDGMSMGCVAKARSRQDGMSLGQHTMWTRTYFACPDCVAALIVVAKLPLMLAARIHVITPGLAVTKLLQARRARTQTTASTARLASVGDAVTSRRASTPMTTVELYAQVRELR